MTQPSVPARPLRIGLVTPAWPGTHTANGIATATAHLAAGLERLGHQVTILANDIDGPHDHPRVVELFATGMTRLQRLRFRWAPDVVVREMQIRRLILGARRAIADQGIDILMLEESFGWVGAVQDALPIPVIATLHGPQWLHRTTPGKPRHGPDARREAWEAAGLRRVAGIISPSRDVLERTRAEWGLPDVPTAVIGNPVALGILQTPAAAFPAPALLFIGRFDRIKGADVLLDAFARVAARQPTCRLTFVGPDYGVVQPDGTLLHLSEALARLPAMARDRITVVGPRSRQEIVEIRRHHPITLLASRYETFGVALIEAMAAGSAVISTRVGGCGEILRDGETGILVPPEDPQALADACLRLLGDAELTRHLGEAARRDVAARFAPEVIAGEVARFLARFCPPRD